MNILVVEEKERCQKLILGPAASPSWCVIERLAISTESSTPRTGTILLESCRQQSPC